MSEYAENERQENDALNTVLLAGLSLDEIEHYRQQGISIEEMAESVNSLALRGEMEMISTEERKPVSLKTAAEFEEREKEFLWYPYLPKGEYTVMMADGGTGKTMLCCGIAAEISKGGKHLPSEPTRDHVRKPANVLIISAEDDGSELRKRLQASGADLDRVYIADCQASEGLNFTHEYLRLAQCLQAADARLVIMDPWHAYLGDDVDINRVNCVRPVFQKVANLAKVMNCAIILVSHVNKRAQGENANNAATGSADFINASRSVIRVINPGDPEQKNTRIAVHTKSNYAPAGRSFLYQITDTGGVKWTGYSDITKESLEEAARRHQTVYEATQKKQTFAENYAALKDAILELSEPGKTVRVTYKQMKDDYGESVFCGMQPKKALEKVSADMSAFGISIKTDLTIKIDKTTARGFAIIREEWGEPEESAEPDDENEEQDAADYEQQSLYDRTEGDSV